MLRTNDYQGCLHALSRAVSQSVVSVQIACAPEADKSANATTALLETMRGFYTHEVKPLFDNKKQPMMHSSVKSAPRSAP